MKHNRHPPNRRRAQAGFTLVEVLLTGVIGAVLLTSVSYATLSFSLTVAHLEKEAGMGTAEDVVMRRLTRDVREAWWVELENSSHIKLANEDGEYLEYKLDDTDLVMIRPDGEEDVMLEDIEELIFEIVDDERFRESTTVTSSGTWYETEDAFGVTFGYELPVGSELAVGFSTPVYSEEVPASSTVEEQVVGVSADVLSLPMTWVPGSAEESLQIDVYQTLGPGLATPIGDALASMTIAGSSLPAAEPTGTPGEYETPDDDVSLSLSSLGVDFEVGAGYALVLQATGDAQLVLKCHGDYADDDDDLMAVSDGTGSNWVDMEFFSMPYVVSGEYTLTSTEVDIAITGVSITLTPAGRPTITRSAAVLSQTVADSPWFGVLPGEEAP